MFDRFMEATVGRLMDKMDEWEEDGRPRALRKWWAGYSDWWEERRQDKEFWMKRAVYFEKRCRELAQLEELYHAALKDAQYARQELDNWRGTARPAAAFQGNRYKSYGGEEEQRWLEQYEREAAWRRPSVYDGLGPRWPHLPQPSNQEPNGDE